MSLLGSGGLLGADQNANTTYQVRDALVGKTSLPRAYRFGGPLQLGVKAVLGGTRETFGEPGRVIDRKLARAR